MTESNTVEAKAEVVGDTGPGVAKAKERATSALVYGGVSIGIDGQMVDATAMWRACGSPKNLRPSDWLRLPGTVAYIAKLSEKLMVGKSHGEENQLVRVSSGGTNPHTKMQRNLALHYAGALDVGLEVEIKEYYLAGYDNGHAHFQNEQALALMNKLNAAIQLFESQRAEIEKLKVEQRRLETSLTYAEHPSRGLLGYRGAKGLTQKISQLRDEINANLSEKSRQVSWKTVDNEIRTAVGYRSGQWMDAPRTTTDAASSIIETRIKSEQRKAKKPASKQLVFSIVESK